MRARVFSRTARLFFWLALSLSTIVVRPNYGRVFAAEPSCAESLARIETAVARATNYLIKQQDADGTWRSQTYALLKDGTSLTPFVLSALPEISEAAKARRRGFGVLTSWIDLTAQPPRVRIALQYPVYTAALALQSLSHSSPGRNADEIAAWRTLLVEQQLDERNGWSPQDARYGGWSYSHERPTKPNEGQPLSPLAEPNLSATAYALAGLAVSDPERQTLAVAARRARRFVERCQNFRENALPSDAKFNDGGFHFLLDDEVRNKPGFAGTDSQGERRFLSYGSATADGLAAIILCGCDRLHPRVLAAQRWLIEHFDNPVHPGNYPASREHLQPALDFYYAASLAAAWHRVGVQDAPRLEQGRWASALADRLIARQREDGSWSNPSVDVREDDPLVATSFALRALQSVRDELRSRGSAPGTW